MLQCNLNKSNISKKMIIIAKREKNNAITELKLDSGVVYSRKQMVDAIKNGKKVKSKSASGPDVHIVRVNNEEYLRTDNNSVDKDNLDNSPNF